MRTEWTARTVTDVVGTAGSVVLDDESTARVVDAATGSGITYEDDETLRGGYDSEWSAERSAEMIYEYLRDRGEPVTKGRTSVSLGTASLALGDDRGENGDGALVGAWLRCGDEGEGWITDEDDIEIAAEYLRAVAHEN